MRTRICSRWLGLLVAAGFLGYWGCGGEPPVADLDDRGFLDHYDQLQGDGESEALRIFVDPSGALGFHGKILIDPITIRASGVAGLHDVPPQEQQALADEAYVLLRGELAQDYEIVDRPGTGVMRLRAALTEAEGARAVLDTVSTVLPTAVPLEGAYLAPGTRLFVHSAGVEAEIIDSVTGQRLYAAVDRKVGERVLTGAEGSWLDVRQAFQDWVDRLRARLASEREKAQAAAAAAEERGS